MTKTLRVAVIGAGRMGADHIKRLSTRIHGAEVAAVVDVDLARAQSAIEGIDGAVALASAEEALNNGDVNAVLIATPGFLHEEILYKALEKNFPILCEKPLTPDAESAWKVVQAEQALGHKRIQVGFMRRFDAEYSALGAMVRNGGLGELLMLHHQHRNPSTPEGFTNEMLINDSVVHEFDAIRYFTGEEITSVQVRLGKPTRSAPNGQHDPQHVLLETESGVLADVEIYVNAKFGYQVATQASFEDGIVSIGGDAGPYIQTAGKWGGNVTPGFEDRFGAAYDVEVQSWVDSALRGEIGGPTAWDGYATAACCEAGVEAQKSGEKVKVRLNTKPDLYK
ncbi:myo-inositol 2-dehydrogenase/D-chiro-inositol 1-dehydrogenase [Paenarthrobacter nicotinovorans]|uniref:Gfo/Idh/MocA family protein n=1 Tax=Micrococcaceae TaxID=1268 RepID=UPI00047ACDC2|nr:MULTISPECIES: Gfo/Idh/MocA family oxidoreductase [Micrococcaceae]MDR6436290.1 myo-inositol 2-dehydrogenase/D-chiro-inositol 1-dehydrogenase [Paenarthrobacter nicotinovorans]SCZ58086.1 myo-inositol 2-dehydrogenase [Arthrobacter sp. UNCCL28]